MSDKLKYLSLGIFFGIFGVFFYTLKGLGLLDTNILKEFVSSFGMLGPFVFAVIYIAIAITGFSAVTLTFMAGLLFGLVEGLIIVVVAATIAATIAFYISRFFIGEEKSNKNKKKGMMNQWIKKIEKGCDKNGFEIVTLLRLSFLPYIPLSYACGLVRNLRARDFIFATFLTNIFGSFVFIYLGNSLGENFVVFIFAILLVLLFMLVPKWIQNKKV